MSQVQRAPNSGRDSFLRQTAELQEVVLDQKQAVRACYLNLKLEVITAGSSLKCRDTFTHICWLGAIRWRRC